MSIVSINPYVVDLLDKNGLTVHLDVTRADSLWEMKAYYSNKSTAPMDKMTLLLAAPKVIVMQFFTLGIFAN